MKHGFGQVDVTKMSGTFGHVARAGLASGGPVDDALAGVHETPEFGAAPFISFRVPDAALGH